MKILFLTEFFPTEFHGKVTGGTEVRTYYVALELLKKGHDVSVITSRITLSKETENWEGLKVIRVGPERDYTTKAALGQRLLYLLFAIIKATKRKYDIVDGNTIAVYLGAFLISKLTGARSVSWIPDVPGLKQWIRTYGFLNGVIATVYEFINVILPVDLVIALSESTKSKILKYNVPEKRITTIYPGFVKTQTKGKIRDIKGKKKLTLISVQRLVNYKRTDLIITSLAKYKTIKEIIYKVIGEGEEKDRLSEMIKKLKLGKKVKLLGNMPHEKVFEEFNKADIFSLPSEIEGFGYVTLEAMSLGLPFVNSDINVHKEIEAMSDAGRLFESGDPKDFNTKLNEVIGNPTLYKKFSTNGLKFAGAKTWGLCASLTEKAYLEVLSK